MMWIGAKIRILEIVERSEAWDKTLDHVDAFFALAGSLITASFQVREMFREQG
jgi:hypothetical protein